MTTTRKIIAGSFRDPSGFLFYQENVLYRQVNTAYRENYDLLIESGLYQALIDSKLLVSHIEEKTDATYADCVYKILKPEIVPFISYPYEWCFSQLKDAALTTLKIQKIALDFGMSLKDSSVYNIQFLKGRPIFIDTLSFEKYQEGSPWVAYKQFCQHFLAPLALMSFSDVRLNQLLKVFIDGVPLDLASSLLPAKTKLNFSLLSHIHLHAKSQKKYESKTVNSSQKKFSRFAFLAMIDNLQGGIGKLKWKPHGTEWGDYYQNTNYSTESFKVKEKLVEEFAESLNPRSAWDIGANTGVFSRVLSRKGIPVVSFDIDPAAVELNYLTVSKNNEINILPQLLDLTNPSPGIGWGNEERSSLIERGPVDLVLALALIHHMAISNNLPLAKVAEFFSRICRTLVIEFVPKNDSQVERLLKTREDVFDEYDEGHFESAFSQYFEIRMASKIKLSERTLYAMSNKCEPL